MYKTLEEMEKLKGWKNNVSKIRITIDQISKYDKERYLGRLIQFEEGLAIFSLKDKRSDGHIVDEAIFKLKKPNGKFEEMIKKMRQWRDSWEKEHKQPIPAEEIVDAIDYIFYSKIYGKCCRFSNYRNKIFKTAELKCYECDYKYFIYLLEAIAKGKEYSEIIGLNELVNGFEQTATVHLRISSDENKTPKEKIKPEITFLSIFDNPKEEQMSFPRIFKGAVSLSLLFYLLTQDRDKLIQCPTCNKFFIGGLHYKTQKYCSEKCGNAARKLSKEEIRSYMRGYRKNLASQKLKLSKREQINDLMKSGYFKNRTEAEEAWKADREMKGV